MVRMCQKGLWTSSEPGSRGLNLPLSSPWNTSATMWRRLMWKTMSPKDILDHMLHPELPDDFSSWGSPGKSSTIIAQWTHHSLRNTDYCVQLIGFRVCSAVKDTIVLQGSGWSDHWVLHDVTSWLLQPLWPPWYFLTYQRFPAPPYTWSPFPPSMHKTPSFTKVSSPPDGKEQSSPSLSLSTFFSCFFIILSSQGL